MKNWQIYLFAFASIIIIISALLRIYIQSTNPYVVDSNLTTTPIGIFDSFEIIFNKNPESKFISQCQSKSNPAQNFKLSTIDNTLQVTPDQRYLPDAQYNFQLTCNNILVFQATINTKPQEKFSEEETIRQQIQLDYEVATDLKNYFAERTWLQKLPSTDKYIVVYDNQQDQIIIALRARFTKAEIETEVLKTLKEIGVPADKEIIWRE